MVTFVNRVKVSVVGAPLTGAVTLGTAVAGYQTPASAGVQDAATVRYTIDDTNQWEVGTGVITVTAGAYTMARTVIDSSQVSGGNINASSNAEVFFTMVGQDIVQNINDIQDVDTQTPQPSANQVLGWDYTSAKWKPQVKGIPILSETPPVDAVDGQIWLDQEDLRSYIRFTDSSSDSWWLETARAGTTGPSGPAGAAASVVATVSARDAIAAPIDGLLCWVTQNSTLYIYKLSNTSWREFTFKDDVDTSLALKQDSNLVVADMAALQAISTPTAGVVALVTGLNKVFMYTGTGWFLIAAMTNDSPTAITGVASTYALATDGTVTTITAVSTDPEGFPLTWSYAVTTGSLGSTATVTQAANVFTITPSSTEADAGEFSLTFSVTDNTTGAVNATSAFTLAFWGGDMANASYDSVSFNVNSQDANPYGLAFNSTGTKMYMLGISSTSVHQYSLSTGFDLSTASYDSVSFSVGGQDGFPTSIWFNSTGTKMYIMGNNNDYVYQYSLSTGFDLSTASYDSVSFSVNSQDAGPTSMWFNPTGTKMYITGYATDTVYQYSLSTGFDLSTASYDSVSFSVGSQDSNPYGIAFNPAGTKMYIMGHGNDTVYQYSLSTGFDLSTASYDSVSFSVNSQDANPFGLAFNPAGTKMYVVGWGNKSIFQYSV